jgi:hypothetical protein
VEDLLSKYWSRIRKAIVSKWGSKVKEADLEKPMSYDQLCKYFGEQCQLREADAKQEVRRLLDEAQFHRGV